MTPFKTIKLVVPLVTTAGVLTELSIRRARPGDAKTFARIDASSSDHVEKMGALIDVFTGLPPGSGENLDWQDFVTVAAAVSDLVHGMAVATRTSRRIGGRR